MTSPANLYAVQRPIIFHIHIPKTGGMTAFNMYESLGYTPIYLHGPSNSFFHEVDEAWWRKNWIGQKWYFHGHYRLAHPTLKTISYPHIVTALLRDPIDRILSHYNFAIRHHATPWHDEVSSGRMGFIEYAKYLLTLFGPQYSFFDDTGAGDLNLTGRGSPERCFDNLLHGVNFFGFTDRFQEFARTVTSFLKVPSVPMPMINVTAELPHSDSWVPLKYRLTDGERLELISLLGADLWFYRRARQVYDYAHRVRSYG